MLKAAQKKLWMGKALEALIQAPEGRVGGERIALITWLWENQDKEVKHFKDIALMAGMIDHESKNKFSLTASFTMKDLLNGEAIKEEDTKYVLVAPKTDQDKYKWIGAALLSLIEEGVRKKENVGTAKAKLLFWIWDNQKQLPSAYSKGWGDVASATTLKVITTLKNAGLLKKKNRLSNYELAKTAQGKKQ